MRNSSSSFERALLILAVAAALVLGMGFAKTVQAASGTPPQPTQVERDGVNAITDDDLRKMDDFLDKHQDIARALRRNPNLINDAAWVNDHAKLGNWLEKHPKIRDEIKANPKTFMRKEVAWDREEYARHHPQKPE